MWLLRIDEGEEDVEATLVEHAPLSLVLPCFNEEAAIGQTVVDCLHWMRERGMSGEIIVVNDGSVDGTEEILRKMKEGSSLLRVITHPKNLGYGAAVRSGCDAARGEWIGFMDSDGQFDPRDFDELLPWCSLSPVLTPSPQSLPVRSSTGSPQGRGRCKEHSFDVVVGRRRKRADPYLRKLNAKLFGILSWAILGIWVRDVNCAMKVFRRSAWEKGRPTVTTGALFNAELFHNLQQSGIRWYQVDVGHYPRRAGKQTGANPKVIFRMFRELWQLKRKATGVAMDVG